MLVDGAKYGDVEIPVFCYEPKLGQPVGACRMCLVEIEGIPKLQTACSTPVKDGMVVHTQTDARAATRSSAVVEFLLINHPLDCPVCDKGGECPLQDISFGWGAGHARASSSPSATSEAARALAADRDRPRALHPLLPLRALLAGDLRGLPAGPARARRALLRRHVRRPPVRRAVQRQHHRAVPGRRAHLARLPLPRAPVGHRGRRLGLHAAARRSATSSSPCATSACMRVLARDHDEVDDGWLCDKGRFAYQSIHVDERITEPLVRDGGELRPASGSARWTRPASALEGARAARAAALAGGETTNEEGFLLARLLRDGLGSPHVDSRAGGALAARARRARSRDPALQADGPRPRVRRTRSSCSTASRSTTRRSSTCASARACAATAPGSRSPASRPSALDPNAERVAALRARRRRGAAGRARRRARRASGDVDGLAAAAGATARRRARARRGCSRGAGARRRDPLGRAPGARRRGAARGRARCSTSPRGCGSPDRDGAGLLEVPAAANGRGLREAGVLPDHGPGLADAAAPRAAAPRGSPPALAERRADRAATCCTPTRCARTPTAALWERALDARDAAVIAHASLLTDDAARARRRRLPGRVLRREGGHGHAPRRAPPAPAPGDRPPRARCAPGGACWPSWPRALGSPARRASTGADGHAQLVRGGARSTPA